MSTIFKNWTRNVTSVALISVLSACSMFGDDLPNYDENQPQDTRFDGELAFSSPSLMKMAESFRIAGDYPNAIRLYQRAATESPRHVTSRLALGQIYQRLGAMDGAMTYYQQVLDLEPDNTEAKLGLGQLMVRNNQSAEAIQYLEDVAENSPDNFRIYNSIGLAYDLEGMHAQAQLAYGKGLNMMPDHISLLNNLALSLAIEGEYAPAIQLLSKALNLDYSQTTAQQNLIMVYALSGEEEAAMTMARSFMTPEELEENMLHYRWLRTLSSQQRAQAIFLNLTSFPEEEASQVVQVATPDQTSSPSVVSIDPKKQLLSDILNSENAEPGGLPENQQMAAVSETPSIDPEELIPEAVMGTMSELYQLQLGSYETVNDVIVNWGRIQGMAPDLLNDQQIDVKNITTTDNDNRYRLFIGEYDNYSAAQEFCLELQERQISCNVLNAE